MPISPRIYKYEIDKQPEKKTVILHHTTQRRDVNTYSAPNVIVCADCRFIIRDRMQMKAHPD